MNHSDYDLLTTRAGYDRWAEIYDGEDNALIALEGPLVRELLGNVKGLDVIDIGCGTGRHAIELAAGGARVLAVDFSEEMLARARRKPGAQSIRFERHDLFKPFPYRGASFDVVLCCLVLDHIKNLDFFFAEMRRICRPTGSLICSVMHPAMMLRGIQARFTDPATGRETRPESYANQISDYVMAAVRAGLFLDHLSEHAVDEALALRSPRARKYLGWPILLLMKARHSSLPGPD